MSQQVPSSEPGPWAAEGTAAHELAEIELANLIDQDIEELESRIAVWATTNIDYLVGDMLPPAKRYADIVHTFMSEMDQPAIAIEKRLDIAGFTFGTADCILIDHKTLHIIDYKYGKGVRVSPVNNEQLMLYAIGALNELDIFGTIETVKLTIFQPRVSPQASTHSMDVEALELWFESVAKPAAEQALSDNGSFNPTDSACRFCPASGLCRAQQTKALAEDFAEPDMLSNEDLAKALDRVDFIDQWISSIRATAFRLAYSAGQTIPGYKVVNGQSRRAIKDEAEAIERLIAWGCKQSEITSRKLAPFGTLDKIVGPDLADILGDQLIKTEPNPVLVPVSDPRPETSSIERDFGND